MTLKESIVVTCNECMNLIQKSIGIKEKIYTILVIQILKRKNDSMTYTGLLKTLYLKKKKVTICLFY